MKLRLCRRDCLEVMRELGDASVVTIADPPYGIGRDWEKRDWRSRAKYRDCRYMNQRPPREYFDEMKRVSSNWILWGWNYFTDGRTCWVKTGVTIDGLEHIEYLPVMDMRNQSIPYERVTSFDVNKAIQRSLTKAVARHGLGLYIYAGEDLPEMEREQQIDEIGNACLEAAAANDLTELEAVYHKYEKKFKSNTYFINAVTKRKNELAA